MISRKKTTAKEEAKAPAKKKTQPKAQTKSKTKAQPKSNPGVKDPKKVKAANRLARELWEPGSRARQGVLGALAAELGVAVRTIQTWMTQPAFIALVCSKLEDYDDAFDRGLKIGLQGDGENLGPNASVLIWYGKTRFRRDERTNHIEQKHQHAIELLEKKAELGVSETDKEITYNITVTEAPMPEDPAIAERRAAEEAEQEEE